MESSVSLRVTLIFILGKSENPMLIKQANKLCWRANATDEWTFCRSSQGVNGHSTKIIVL